MNDNNTSKAGERTPGAIRAARAIQAQTGIPGITESLAAIIDKETAAPELLEALLLAHWNLGSLPSYADSEVEAAILAAIETASAVDGETRASQRERDEQWQNKYAQTMETWAADGCRRDGIETDLRAQLSDLREAHGGAILAQAAAVERAEKAEQETEKAQDCVDACIRIAGDVSEAGLSEVTVGALEDAVAAAKKMQGLDQ